MKKILKFVLLILVSLIFISTFFFFLNQLSSEDKAKIENRYIRKNIHSPEAQSDVEALNKALKIMRQSGCSDPTSWYYQASIHWIPDTINNQNLCDTYHNKSQLKEAWDNCTHTKESEIHFLVWHRLYIYHFEKIVRKLSGKKDFAIPYWGYTENDEINKTLHPLFYNKKSSLYEVARFDSLNSGYPISGEIERALDVTSLFKLTSYRNFNHQMDIAPHGAIHDYVGAGNGVTGELQFSNQITGTITSTGLMGWVPTAAFDPIFWTHHANVDRLWQQWTNSTNGQPVTLEDLNSTNWQYVFFDENGKKVTYTNEEVIKIIYNLDYNYDDCEVKSKVYRVKIQKPITALISKPSEKINVSLEKVSVGSSFQNLKGRVVEMTISYTTRPRGIYEVYLNGDSTLNPSDDEFLGFMTFFGTDHKAQGKTCLKGCCGELTSGRLTQTFRWEITNETAINQNLNLHIFKPNGKVNSDMIIEKIKIN
jgi:hypothetical protein